MAQFTALLGGVEDDIVDCFHHGGGVPYSRFPKFQALMAEASGRGHDVALIDGVLSLVDGIRDRLEAGIDVLDVGCGQGHAANLLAQAFPASRFTGIDFSDEAVAAAREESADLGVTNTSFEMKDAASLGGGAQYDFITVFDAIHDQAKPDVVLRGIAASLRPDGAFLCVDVAASSNVEDNIGHPLGPMLYSVSTFHCMTVSLAQGGAGLGTVWGEQKANEMLRAAGFNNVVTKKIPEDFFNVYYVCRTG
jgi:ubiquinone/menaquinone biosynthesis C-methylase UbiE